MTAILARASVSCGFIGLLVACGQKESRNRGIPDCGTVRFASLSNQRATISFRF